MRRHRHRLLVAFAAVVCAAPIAGCGSSSKSSSATGGSSSHASFVRYSVCMRSHGVSNFPDPSPNGGIHIGPGSGINLQSPGFQSAQQACKKLLPGGGPPSTGSESDKLAALKNAQCMRKHGVPDFPDPTFHDGLIGVDLGSINPQSPAFRNAAKACGGA